MNQEYIIENAERVQFRDMSEADQHVILKAKLNSPKILERFSNSWQRDTGAHCILMDAAYRVRAIATPLMIPWEFIQHKWNWAAMDEDKEVRLYANDPIMNQVMWRPCDGDCCSLDHILDIDTTSVDWRRSKTRRPV